MKNQIRTIAATAALTGTLMIGIQSIAQQGGGQQNNQQGMGQQMGGQQAGTPSTGSRQIAEIMNRAGEGMRSDRLRLSNDTDLAFGEAMIALHQAAVDVSKVAAANGNHPKMKTMAEMMGKMHAIEIQQLQLMLQEARGGMSPMPMRTGGK